jgi:uncharacterized protein YggE
MLAIALAAHVASAQTPAADLPSIVTTGEAVVRRAPDIAYITFAVETRARNPRDAQTQNATAMSAVRQRLASLGLAADALRTLGYTIRQEFDFVNGRQVPRDYLARNSIEVRLDAVERAGEILDAGVQAGATSVGGIRFDLRDRASAEREALRLAVVDARARADAAAAGAGRAVDRVIKIEDSRQLVEPPRPMAEFARAAVAQAETPVESGTIEIRSTVTLTVSLK